MTDQERKAMEMALERLTMWLEDFPDTAVIEDRWAVEALRQALAQDHGFDRTASHMAGEYVDTNWDTSDMAHRTGGLSVDLGTDRGAWSDVPDATKWVDELRGDEDAEQEHESRITSLEIRVAKLEKPMTEHEKQLLAGQRSLLRTAPPSKQEQEKESTAQTVDPRVLLGRSNNFTKETENRLCDIERRLAVIETQPAPPSKSEQEPEKEKEPAATSIHYPDCWDTACYPTLQDAIKEI